MGDDEEDVTQGISINSSDAASNLTGSRSFLSRASSAHSYDTPQVMGPVASPSAKSSSIAQEHIGCCGFPCPGKKKSRSQLQSTDIPFRIDEEGPEDASSAL